MLLSSSTARMVCQDAGGLTGRPDGIVRSRPGLRQDSAGQHCAAVDLDTVFTSLDRATSEPGRQILYHLLLTPTVDEAPLLRLEAAVEALAAPSVASHSETVLRQLEDPRAAHIVELLFRELPRRPRLWWCFPLLTISSIRLLVLYISGL